MGKKMDPTTAAWLDSFGISDTAAPSTNSTTDTTSTLDKYLTITSPPDGLTTLEGTLGSSYLAPSISTNAQQSIQSALNTLNASSTSNTLPDWRCYYRGDLNPQLNQFTFNDILANPSLAGASEHPLGAIGEAIGRLIRPDMTRHSRGSLIKAVVLGSYVVEGQEALSYNLNIESSDIGASANRIQMLYIRVPELTHLPDPYCPDLFPFDMAQQQVIVEMHPIAAVPNWVSTQPTVVPGSIVEVEFNQGFSRAIVKNILEKATDLQSVLQTLGASDAFGGHGTGVFIGAPVKGAEGAHDFVNKMRASPHLKDYSDAMLAALASNAQHESNFIVNANGDSVAGYAGTENKATRKRVNDNALDGKCSHGFWQMNVCAKDGGGQRFAKHFNLDVVKDKQALVNAFADPEKQFEMINIEMRHLFGDDVVNGTGTAEYYAGRISAEYERCHSCYKGGNQWTSRSKVAMGIYSEITTTTTT